MNLLKGLVIGLGLIILVSPASVEARLKPGAGQNRHQIQTQGAVEDPGYGIAVHNIGKIALAVNNNGTFGDGFSPTCAVDQCTDFFTGLPIPSCEYPKGSNTKYLFAGAFWIGAVVGRDTLVSVAADGWSQTNEFFPDEGKAGQMIYRSTIDPANNTAFKGAVSEQDYICVYYDTCVSSNCPGSKDTDFLDAREHQPLNVEVTQRSYAWSYDYADDFVLFDYSIRNIGQDRLSAVYMGVYVDADIHQMGMDEGAQDDICGFREKQPALYLPSACPDSDVVNIAWTADNDGDFDEGAFSPVPHITATRIVRTPSDSLDVSFNWWISNQNNPDLDFGPQTRAKYRDLQTGGSGTPEGDRNKFHYLSNGEFDYDQPQVGSIDASNDIWLPPPNNRKRQWSRGMDTRYLLSFGPFDIEPGQSLPISFAYVAGQDFHDPSTGDNIDNLPDNWEAYYENVSFDSLGSNATWAEWIYDNPGLDTDSDGYAGERYICNLGGDSTWAVDTTVDSAVVPWDTIVDPHWEYSNADTTWRRGDGIPDFQGASPPPAPSTYTSHKGFKGLRVEPGVGEVRVIWNGVRSENTRDVFSREFDFEGYRVYIAQDDRRGSYAMEASYDIEDYNRWDWDPEIADFLLRESPFTLEQLRAEYGEGDPDWHPLNFTRSRPYVDPDDPTQVHYFTMQDFNMSILGHLENAQTPIKKVYKDAPKPSPDINIDTLTDAQYAEYLTPEGFFKYYEYEYTFKNLLPTIPYLINVTAFDYGSPKSGLSSLETSPTIIPSETYALESVDRVVEQDLEVFVYPNPYRFDGAYREQGFEGRGDEDRAADRVRRIHFANLPPKCTISIFTPDGDLVRELVHDLPTTDPLANHETWDLITRNTQLTVSGLYYWTVEDDKGNTQIGKLVIIM